MDQTGRQFYCLMGYISVQYNNFKNLGIKYQGKKVIIIITQ